MLDWWVFSSLLLAQFFNDETPLYKMMNIQSTNLGIFPNYIHGYIDLGKYTYIGTDFGVLAPKAYTKV